MHLHVMDVGIGWGWRSGAGSFSLIQSVSAMAGTTPKTADDVKQGLNDNICEYEKKSELMRFFLLIDVKTSYVQGNPSTTFR